MVKPNATASCRDCKYLERYTIAGDIFWHYRCANYPNAKKFDSWKSLSMGRDPTSCGYVKKESKDTKTPWDGSLQTTQYAFKNGYCNKIKKD